MNLKHYLRGLGMGILVTAVILGFTGKTEKMTDAEIKIRAAQLGMVEETVLSDLAADEKATGESKESRVEGSKASQEEGQTQIETEEELSSEETEEKEEASSGNPGNEEENNEEASSEAAQGEGRADTEASSDSSDRRDTTGAEANEIITQEENYVIFTIEPGENSSSVTKKLQTAGLIESVEEYNKYLSENDYTRKLKSGSHKIPIGASGEQIAKILCRLD